MGGKTRAELEAATEALGNTWFHSIDLGHGVITPGHKSAAQLESELRSLRLPDLRGKTVLDIGAWDGYFSFAAERLGADRVVALDHYAWSIDFAARYRYEAQCRQRGVIPRPWEDVPEVWRPDSLPGKACFDAAHEALASRVESIVADFTAVDPHELGLFDVVLFLGVLYHVRDPFGALQRVAALTNELAVIESAMIVRPGSERVALCQFVGGDQLAGDPTNWWVPNRRALREMCLASRFVRVEANRPSWRGRIGRHRAVFRAWK